MQKLTIRCLTVTHRKLTFTLCWGLIRRQTGRNEEQIQCGQWIYYRAVSWTSVETEHPKNVLFLAGPIYHREDKQLPCRARYDIQHPAGPLGYLDRKFLKRCSVQLVFGAVGLLSLQVSERFPTKTSCNSPVFAAEHLMETPRRMLDMKCFIRCFKFCKDVLFPSLSVDP